MNGELYIIILGIIIIFIIVAYIFLYYFRSEEEEIPVNPNVSSTNLANPNMSSINLVNPNMFSTNPVGQFEIISKTDRSESNTVSRSVDLSNNNISSVSVPTNSNKEECTVNEQCPGSMLCINNTCTMCKIDKECGEGNVCIDGTCQPKKKYGESCEQVPCDIGLECIKFGDGNTVKVCLPKNSVLSISTSNTRKDEEDGMERQINITNRINEHTNEDNMGRSQNRLNEPTNTNEHGMGRLLNRMNEPIYPIMNKTSTNAIGSGEIKQKVYNKKQVNVLAQKMEHKPLQKSPDRVRILGNVINKYN